MGTQKKHKKAAAAYGGLQAEFGSNGTLGNLQTLKDYLTPQDLIVRAEIIEVLNSVELISPFIFYNKELGVSYYLSFQVISSPR